jgi:ABC-type transporter Mla subunit MlaD
MLGRVIAVFLLLVGIVGIGIAIVGVVFGYQVVDALGESLDETLALTSESLNTVTDTLLLTKKTVAQTGQAIGTVSETTDSVAQMLVDTQPLLDDVSQVTTVDVPNSLDAVQGAVPNLVSVAGTIDNTLETLSNFNFERTIFGIPLGFDLGIDYDPEAPFEESVAQIGTSLEGVPDNLRGLQVHLDTTNDNLATISDNLQTLTADLATIESTVEEVGPLLDEYIRLVGQIESNIAETRGDLDSQLQTVKTGIIILFVWFGLNQLVPLYLGADLITDGRLGSRPGSKKERLEETADPDMESEAAEEEE